MASSLRSVTATPLLMFRYANLFGLSPMSGPLRYEQRGSTCAQYPDKRDGSPATLGYSPAIAGTPSTGPRVVVVNDRRLQRECLVAQLTAEGFQVDGVWDLPSLLSTVPSSTPAVILIKSGTEDAATLMKASLVLGPSPKVVVFDLAVDRQSEIIGAAEAGVAGLHLRSESFEHLLDLIRTAGAGQARCSSEVSNILLRRVYSYARQINPDARTETLSAREAEILQLIAQGLSNQQISSRLTLSLPTVKNHVHRLLTKMGVGSRAEAVSVYRANQYSNPIQN